MCSVVWGLAQSEELKARLRKLQELAEKNAYLELVKDITPRKVENEPFSSYKDQLGFGNYQSTCKLISEIPFTI